MSAYICIGKEVERLVLLFLCVKKRGKKANGEISTDENASKVEISQKRGGKRLYLNKNRCV